MALDAVTLADDIKTAMGFGAEPQSTELTNLAQDIVTHILTAVVSNAPGTVTGDAPPAGGPLINGAASGGVILLISSALDAAFTTSFGISTPEISGMASAISAHIAAGTTEFAIGNITGTCSNTAAPSPGPLLGQGTGGTIVGLVGATLAADISTGVLQGGVTPTELLGMSNAIDDHVALNGEAAYAPGTITGTAPSGGGPIPDGAGAGGTIS